MSNEITDEQAESIARNAQYIPKARLQIDNAEKLIKVLETQPSPGVTISISSYFRQEDYRCEVSVPSAICLLCESIEMKRNRIKSASEELRDTLNK